MKTLNAYILAFALVVFASGCSDKEDDPSIMKEAPACQATQIVTMEDGQSTATTLTYDSKGRVGTVKMESEGIEGTLEYNSDNNPTSLLVSESPFGPGSIQFTYDGTKLTKSEVFSSFLPGAALARSTFSYNSAGKMTKLVEYEAENFLSGNLTFSGYTTFTYDGAGNITKEQRYEGTSEATATLFSTVDYTYDTAPNPLHKLETLMRGTSSTNNIKTAITKYSYSNFQVDPGQSYSVAYTYNSSNYFTQATQTTQTNQVSTVNVTYQCQ